MLPVMGSMGLRPRESAEPGQLGVDPTALPSSASGRCLDTSLSLWTQQGAASYHTHPATYPISMQKQSQMQLTSAAKGVHRLACKGYGLSVWGFCTGRGTPSSEVLFLVLVDKQVSVM